MHVALLLHFPSLFFGAAVIIDIARGCEGVMINRSILANYKASLFLSPFVAAASVPRELLKQSVRLHSARPTLNLESQTSAMEPISSQRMHFDLFVIGAGSGGMACARRAAAYGMKVGIAEHQRLGGTCVNVGCVPKKVMWNAANLQHSIHDLHHYGITVEKSSFDWNTLKAHRDAYVTRLNGIYEKNLDNSGIVRLHGACSFCGLNKLRIKNSADDTVVTADHVLIATGGKPALLNIPGEEHTINSDGFFELKERPNRVAVIGAGYIAVELVGIFHNLGSETHLFVRGKHALRKFDTMLTGSLHADMIKHGVKMHPGSVPKEVVKDDSTGKLTLRLDNGQSHPDFDCILVATGRVPCVESLALDAAGVKVNAADRNCILVDEYQVTSNPNVYALGDVCGKVELTPMAIAAGRRLADRLFGNMPGAKADYASVPTVIFTHPPIGTVGLTEHEAKQQYGEDNIKVYRNSSVNLYYGPFQISPENKPKTVMKLVCLKPTEKVLGAHVYGMGADEMIQGFGVAIKMGATKSDFDNCVAVHPTAAEEFVTMAPWGLKEDPKKQ